MRIMYDNVGDEDDDDDDDDNVDDDDDDDDDGIEYVELLELTYLK